MKLSDNRLVQILILFFGVGLILHIIPGLRFITTWITEAFLLGANLLVLYRVFFQTKQMKLFWFVLAAWLFTYAAEVIGVASGRVFGAYSYGDTFKIQLMAVPLIIPLNWAVLAIGTLSIIREQKIPFYQVPVVTALGMVLFDFIMEPVAIQLDYWNWAGVKIPLQNYIAWFIIALMVSIVAEIWKIRLQSRVLRYYLLIQFVFFLILNVFFRLAAA